MCDPTGAGSSSSNLLQPQAWQPPSNAIPAGELASAAAAWASGPTPISAEQAPKGGFWMRVLAYLIDSVIIGLPAYALGVSVLHGTIYTASSISVLIEVLYFTYYWSRYGKGQTIGMQLLHMKVVKTDGSLLSPMAAFVRFIGLIIASLPLDLGLIWVGLDSKKQGWHDKIAGTYVVSNW
jgi:uncharacterized RDD family membrane protein YckC